MVKKKIIKNTLYNIVSYGYSAIVGFFLVPFILKNLGVNRYGIWSLITMIIGYFSLIDFGISQSFERYIAEYNAKREIKSLNYVINSGLLVYLLMFLILLPLSFISPDFLIKILKIPSQFQNEAKFIFRWAIIYLGFSNISGLFYSSIRGFQRMDISGKVTMFLTTIHAIGVILFLKTGWGIKGLMVNNFLISSIGGIIYLYFLFKIFPELNLDFLILNREILKKLTKFGIKRWITTIEEVITYQTDKFFISHFLNLPLVSIYQIGYTIPEKLASMVRLLNSAIVPASAELKALNEKEKLIKLYILGTKYISFIAFPLFFFIFSSAPLIINIWVGKGYENSVIVLRLFCIIFLITLLSSNLTAILVGIERPEFQMYAGLFQGVLNLILTFLFVKSIGFLGVIIATLISISLSTSYLIFIFHRILGISFFSTFKKSIAPSFFVSILLTFFIYLTNSRFFISQYKVKNLGILVLEFVFFILIFGYILRDNFKEIKEILIRGGK